MPTTTCRVSSRPLLRGLAILVGSAIALSACSVPPEQTSGQVATPTSAPSGGDVEQSTAIPTPAPTAVPTLQAPTPAPEIPLVNGIEDYAGLGAWLDVWDYSPTYSVDGVPAVGPEVLDDMAAVGVRTLYLQTVRRDDRTTALIEDPDLLAAFVRRAHSHDIAVVGWYLPTWTGPEHEDLDRLVAVLEFDVDGNRFDGVAVDIEGVPLPEDRADWNRRLISLSTDLREAAGDRAVGAIVLPPVLIEEVNDQYWPNFPWAEIGPLYDAWLPMAYWSFRESSSPWADPAAYAGESIERLRINVGDPGAVVHAIGGIGLSETASSASEPVAAVGDLAAFVQAAESSGSVGWSIYDWMTIDSAGRQRMSELDGQ